MNSLTDPRCGTYNGYRAHRRRNEEACEDCKRANADYNREYRVRTGRTTHALVPILRGRERELLDAKGPCRAPGCSLHYAHIGPCRIEAGK